MKRRYLLCLLLTIFSISVQAQWQLQNVSPTSRGYKSIQFIDETTGWVTGGNVVVKTTDGGETWNLAYRYTNTVGYITMAHFADANTGWAVGDSKTLLKTTDGGNSWVAQSTPVSGAANFYNVWALTPTTAIVVGSSGIILRTTNGGSTWTELPKPHTSDIQDIYFLNSTTGWAVGSGGNVLRTTDGGQTWSGISSVGNTMLVGVHFRDANNGWTTGWGGTNGGLFKTTDGGSSWDKIGGGNAGYDVYSSSANNMLYSFNGVPRGIAKSTDGGNNFTAGAIHNYDYINGFYFFDATTGWAVAGSGQIFKTTDGGDNWVQKNTGDFAGLSSMQMFGSKYGWAIGADVILKTTDGQTWNRQFTNNLSDMYMTGSYFHDKNTGWITSAGGVVYKTTDAGQNWTTINTGSGYYLQDIYFASDGTTGWTVGWNGAILKTTNGGTSWTSQNSGTTAFLYKVYFVNNTKGWAIGNTGTILATTDGGSTWTKQTSGTTVNLTSMQFIDGSTGWACGSGTVLKTTNGGSTWTIQSSSLYSISAIKFANASVGWAAGNKLFKTVDGGANWTDMGNNYYGYTNDMAFASTTDTMYMAGANGMIVKAICNSSASISPANLNLPDGAIGTPYNQQLTQSGLDGSVTWAVTQGTLPDGLSLNASTGLLSGTPTTGVPYATFTVQATNGFCSIVKTYELNIPCPTVTFSPTSLSNATQYATYSAQISVTGVTPTYYSISAGSLPDGLSMSGTGLISGTPTTSGTFNFTVNANGSCAASKAYSLVVNVGCPMVTFSPSGSSVGTATQNSPYTQTISQTGLSSPTWSISAGSLPSGITLSSSTGQLSGTPTVSGSFSFTITASASGCSGSKSYTMSVSGACVATISPISSTLSDGYVNSAYSQQFTQTGMGFGIFSVTAGALPSGLSMNTAGLLNGTPTAVGTYNFTVTATNGSCSGSRAYTLVIGSCPSSYTFSPSGSALTAATSFQYYTQTVSVAELTSPTYSIYLGPMGMGTGLPSGLSINSTTGVISGTPTTVETRTFTVRAIKGACVADKSYTISICGNVTFYTSFLQAGSIGTPYSATISQSLSGATFSVSAGSLPDGLSLNSSTGAITGTPSSAAVTSTFTVMVTNGSCSGTRDYTINICPNVTLLPATLSNPTVGVAYSQQFTQTGFAEGTYFFMNYTGALPTGLSLSSDGLLSGTPTEAGSFSFAIGVTNGSSCGKGIMYSVTVGAGCTASISPSSLSDIERGYPVSETLTASGISSPTFSVSAGALPTGISLSASGVLSGTPNTTGTYNFTVTATDGSCSASRTYAWVVTCPFFVPGPNITANGSTSFCEGGSVSLTASGTADGYIWSNGATGKTITVTQEGGISVRAIIAGCTTAASQVLLIEVYQAPIAPVITGTTTLPLGGGSVTLTASAGYNSYLWSNGATTQSITVSSEGSYTVRGTNLLGCQSAPSAAAVVTQASCGSPYVFNACGTSFSISCDRLGSSVWYMSWQTSAAISSYRIFWKPTGASTWYSTPTYDGSRNNFKLENLIPNTSYDIKFLVGCTATGTAVYTNTKQFQTLNLLCTVPIFTPTTVGKNIAELSFAVTPSISYYELMWKPSSSSTWQGIIVNNTPAIGKTQITGLSAGTLYNFRVRGICNNGYQDMTRYIDGSFTTASQVLCSVPAFSVSPAAGGNLLVNWDNAAYKSVKIYWKAQGTTKAKSDTTSANSYLITGLVTGEVYEIQMQGVCKALGEITNYSLTQTVMSTQTLSCATPNIDSTRGFANRTAKVYWTNTTNIAGLEIQRRPLGGVWNSPQPIVATATQYTFASNAFPISNGDMYEIRIRAKCADNNLWAGYKYDTLFIPAPLQRLGHQTTSVSIYPNPSTGIVNVLLGNAQAADYLLFNAMGKQVAAGQLKGNEQENVLDINEFAAGLYVLKVRTANELFTKQIHLVK